MTFVLQYQRKGSAAWIAECAPFHRLSSALSVYFAINGIDPDLAWRVSKESS